MNITLIGAGNLATNLGVALSRTNHIITQVYSRTIESAEALAQRLSCPSCTRIEDIQPGSDIYIISIKDSALSQVATDLQTYLAQKGDSTPLLVHTAGSMPLDVLPTTRRGVLYPMQTFSRTRLVDFDRIPTFVESHASDDLQIIKQLANSVTTAVYDLDSDSRRYLHLSAVFACNFVNHCYDLSAQLLAPHGIPFEVMLPLIDETARKVHQLDPHDAQTGPAIRWDENVINKQISLLEGQPHLQALYETLSRSIHDSR